MIVTSAGFWKNVLALVPLAAVLALTALVYNVLKDRRQRNAERDTAHRLFRPLFEDLESNLRTRGTNPDRTTFGPLGAVAHDKLREIASLLAQHGAKLPEDERKVLFDAHDKTRKLEYGGSIPSEVFNAARQALVEAVKVLKG